MSPLDLTFFKTEGVPAYDDNNAFQALCARLAHQRKAAQPYLYPWSLDIIRHSHPTEPPRKGGPFKNYMVHPPPFTIPPDAYKRFFRTPNAEVAVTPNELQSSRVSVSITEPMSIGMDRWSQLWRGTLTVKSNIGTTKDMPVVIKVFQTSYMKLPFMVDPEFGINDGEWEEGPGFARKEAWAYSKMVDIQGTVVPLSYGFYEVKLPHGEVSYAHVMEYVKGDSLELLEKKGTLHPRNEFDDFAEQLTSTMAAVQACGVVHGDIVFPHIIAHGSSPSDSFPLCTGQLVVVDFHLATPYDADRARVDVDYSLNPLGLFDVGWTDIAAWFHKMSPRNPPPWWLLAYEEINDEGFFEGNIYLEKCTKDDEDAYRSTLVSAQA